MPVTAPVTDEDNTANAGQTLADVNQQLASLIAGHQYDGAYQLAQIHLANFEGEPAFDFHYGYAAAQSGRYNEAVFPFERLVSEFPAIPRYRLELARAYYQVGNPEAAEEQFLLVKDTQPPANVVATIDSFLEKINEQKQMIKPVWSGYVTGSGGYDTNYNSATDVEQIDIYNGVAQARLDADSREKASGYYQLRGQTSYVSPLNMRSAWDVQVGGSRKDNAADDLYDLDNLFAGAGIRFIRNGHNIHSGLKANWYWLGDQLLQRETSLLTDWRYPLGNWQLKSALTLRSQDNALNNELDLMQAEFQFGAGYGTPSYSLQAALVVATDSAARADYQARDTLGLNLNGQYLLDLTSSLYCNLMVRDYQFQAEFPDENAFAAGQTRDEQMTQISFGYGRTLQSWLTLYAQVSYIGYQSNIELYEYDRTLSEAGITLSF
ncbi:tetratricopeptide repeat protein [Thalassolituus sp. LLYu03]|uniref:tetratricopeptide repeat protein n=1 Tax=Thalassolituus sp. LLYu03 TaxID=3421656 RepID=UPI003D2B5531